MKKKIVILLMILALCISAASCATKTPQDTAASTAMKSSDQTGTSPEGPTPLFTEPVTLRLLTNSHPSWPYQEDWYVVKMIKEKTNVTISPIMVDEDSIDQKIQTMMAAGDVPELTFNWGIPVFQTYGAQGAYVNVLDYVNILPNFSAWMSNNQAYINDFKSADGKLYVMPDQGISETDREGWFYRKDIFEKNNLSLPANETEFFDLLVKLKQLYPDSYPFSFRSQLLTLSYIAPSWGTSYQGDRPLVYDKTDKTWKFGPIEENFKALLEFYNKLYTKGLIPPDFLTLDTKGWQDLISTDKGFITFDYLGRIDMFNNAVRQENPSFTMAYMSPWKGGANGVNKMGYSGYPITAWAIGAKSPKVESALKYIDWMYSEAARDLLSWGEEGKTYTVADGKRKFIDVKDMSEMRKKYGLSTNGFYALFNYDSHISLFTPELSEAVMTARNDLLDPIPNVSMIDSDLNDFTQTFDPIKKYVDDNISKFILGERSFTEWDAYVKDIRDMGLQKVIDIQTQAYLGQMGGQ